MLYSAILLTATLQLFTQVTAYIHGTTFKPNECNQYIDFLESNGNPGKVLDVCQDYNTTTGFKVTACGYTNANVQTALYSRSRWPYQVGSPGIVFGPDNGLGINNSNVYHRLDSKNYIQLNVMDLKTVSKPTSVKIAFSDFEPGNKAEFYGSDKPGELGVLIVIPDFDQKEKFFNLPGYPAYNYISVRAAPAYDQDMLITGLLFNCDVCYDLFSFIDSATDWNSPQDVLGNIGFVHTFQSETNPLLQVTARGYNINGTNANMFRKGYTRFGNEDGLGMATDIHNDHEIDKVHFLQLDFQSFKNLTPAPTHVPKLQFGSTQSTEDVALYGSNDEGVLGTSIGTFTGNAAEIVDFMDIPRYNEFRYISAIATGSKPEANILINGILLNCDRVTPSPSAAPVDNAGDSIVTYAPSAVPSYAPSAAPSPNVCQSRLGGSTTCQTCENCAKCVGFTEADGKKYATIDFTCCKNSGSMSWIYCKNSLPFATVPPSNINQCSYISGCSSTSSVTLAGNSGLKCNDQSRDKSIVFSIDATKSSLTLQMHDGRFIGNDSVLACPNKNPTSVWAGGCKGSCGTNSACEMTIPISFKDCQPK